ncbi:MAG: hypothetical protein WBY12_06330, partial [Hyphomicrobium sp.]
MNNHERVQTEKEFLPANLSAYPGYIGSGACDYPSGAGDLYAFQKSWCSGADTNAFLFTETVNDMKKKTAKDNGG